MREVKFRGKRKDNGEWVYGSLIHRNAYDLRDGVHRPCPTHTRIERQDIEWVGDPNNPGWTFLCFQVLPETVGQYTNKKDQDAKDIYEGDGLYFPVNTSGVWFDQAGKIVLATYPFVCGNTHLGKIVGNIHDNPELLEGETNDS